MFNDMVKWNMCIENNTFKFTHHYIYSVFLIFSGKVLQFYRLNISSIIIK